MKEERVCPACGKEYRQAPAISRKDNKTEICPCCGVLEAVEAAGIAAEDAAVIMNQVKEAQQKAEQKAAEPMNRYKVCFISGETGRYIEWETVAANKEAAIEKFNRQYGAAFEHQYENGAVIKEIKEDV